MSRRLIPFLAFLALVAVGLWFALGPGTGPGDVTVYTAVDDEIARTILDRFAAETGIRVETRTDTEATKTVGLVNTLMEESRPGRTPRADLFWNNEPVWTVRLAAAGVLEKYDSPAARDIPAAYRDPGGTWTANGLRARILIVNREKCGERLPSGYPSLAEPAFAGAGGMARPLAGTTLSHMAALRAALGPAAWEEWIRATATNDTFWASGNGSLAREVGRGARAFGFTDTDDFAVRRHAGEPVEMVFPDQGEGGIGTFVLPVTVSLVRGAPHPEAARRLYDWLVSPATEAALSATTYATIPVRPGTPAGPDAVSLHDFRAAAVDWDAAAANIDPVLDVVNRILAGK